MRRVYRRQELLAMRDRITLRTEASVSSTGRHLSSHLTYSRPFHVQTKAVENLDVNKQLLQASRLDAKLIQNLGVQPRQDANQFSSQYEQNQDCSDRLIDVRLVGKRGVIQRGKARSWKNKKHKYEASRLVNGVRKRISGDAKYGSELRYVRKAVRRGLKIRHNESTRSVKSRAYKILGIKYNLWKQGREGQHLCPASIGMKLGIPNSLINGLDNFMMIREGNRKKGKGLSTAYRNRKKSQLKTTRKFDNPRHIKKGISHPYYNKFVLKNVPKNFKPQDPTMVKKWFAWLRKKHQQPGVAYVDDIV